MDRPIAMDKRIPPGEKWKWYIMGTFSLGGLILIARFYKQEILFQSVTVLTFEQKTRIMNVIQRNRFQQVIIMHPIDPKYAGYLDNL